jgi:hypothetical protein
MALAAVLCAGAAVPAFAAWDRIGSVDVSYRNGTDVAYGNFGGRVEALSLSARGGDVMCRDVTATFGNGNTRSVFHGFLPRGRDVTVDLPGENGRMIRRLEFNCRSNDRDGARVEIAADVGRYQAEWRRSPDWDRVWSRMFHWDDRDNRYGNDRDRYGRDRYVTGQLDTSGWVMLSSERFEGRGDREVAFPGVNGRNLDAIALRPTDGDARCSKVRIHFQNGRFEDIPLERVLPENRLTSIDLPGTRRDVTRIGLDCQAVRGPSVTLQVMASK